MSTKVEAIMRKAAKTNLERDAMDRASGLAAPQDCPLEVQLRTVASALECSLEMDDWDNVAEGLVMLQTSIAKLQEERITR